MPKPKQLPRRKLSTGVTIHCFASRSVDSATPASYTLLIPPPVINVTVPILAADAFLEAGCAVVMYGNHNTMRTPGGSELVIERQSQSWCAGFVLTVSWIAYQPKALTYALYVLTVALPKAHDKKGLVAKLNRQSMTAKRGHTWVNTVCNF